MRCIEYAPREVILSPLGDFLCKIEWGVVFKKNMRDVYQDESGKWWVEVTYDHTPLLRPDSSRLIGPFDTEDEAWDAFERDIDAADAD
jgi:hypothetical protein